MKTQCAQLFLLFYSMDEIPIFFENYQVSGPTDFVPHGKKVWINNSFQKEEIIQTNDPLMYEIHNSLMGRYYHIASPNKSIFAFIPSDCKNIRAVKMCQNVSKIIPVEDAIKRIRICGDEHCPKCSKIVPNFVSAYSYDNCIKLFFIAYKFCPTFAQLIRPSVSSGIQIIRISVYIPYGK